MEQLSLFESMNQPVPDKLKIKFYKDMILIEARDRIYELLDNERTADAQAMAKEWKL